MAAFEARHDAEIDPHLAVLLAVCADAVDLHHLAHVAPPALRACLPAVARVRVSLDLVATFEHAIIDGRHGLPAGYALGAHADNAAAWIASTLHSFSPLASGEAVTIAVAIAKVDTFSPALSPAVAVSKSPTLAGARTPATTISVSITVSEADSTAPASATARTGPISGPQVRDFRDKSHRSTPKPPPQPEPEVQASIDRLMSNVVAGTTTTESISVAVYGAR